jgi:hypothetical protein
MSEQINVGTVLALADVRAGSEQTPQVAECAGLGAEREAMMSVAHGHCTAGHAVVEARPVVLLRYRPGITGETGRAVHLVPLPPAGQVGAAGVALCGVLLRPDQVEMVSPGQGMPCILCMMNHLTASPAPVPADISAVVSPGEGISGETDPLVAVVCYQAWGWPVTLRGNQVWLSMEPDTVALTIPVLLAARVAGVLNQRRCPPLTLIHPEMPEHWVMLAGERDTVALPWPTWVSRNTETLPLPPTVTPCGPISWVHPPEADALQVCREFEVFAALRTALRDLST